MLYEVITGVVVSVCRIAVLYIPIAILAMQFFDIAGIFAAYAIANIVSVITSYSIHYTKLYE